MWAGERESVKGESRLIPLALTFTIFPAGGLPVFPQPLTSSLLKASPWYFTNLLLIMIISIHPVGVEDVKKITIN